jgi:stage V sporulation protein D (sporulation-specific penicillin-binding protein)
MAQRKAQGTRRVWVPAAFLGAFALVIFARLVQLQVIDHPHYADAAQRELLGKETVYARRGSILDRNGSVLALSENSWDIHVNTTDWSDPDHAKTGAQALANALHLDPATLRSDIAQAATHGQIDVLVQRDFDYDLGNALIKAAPPGVSLRPSSIRVNPEGDIAASLLGIIGQDKTGLAGLELAENDALQGQPGKIVYESDAANDPIPVGQYVASEPRPGRDLVLTIDQYVQQLAEQKLAQAIKDHKATGGSIIVMDPSTGEILGLASSPGIKYSELNLNDPNVGNLLKNVAISDTYEPGSVMKVVTAASAIDAGVVTPDTTYVDTGVAYVEKIPLKNFQDGVWGTQTMTAVLQQSINTGAVFMEQALGQARFQEYLRAFGFGKPTGIDFDGEATGIVRWMADKDYSPVDAATQAFGQSIGVTPIQMISAVAAAINGGNLIKPHFVKATVGADGVRHDVQPEIVGRPISAATSASIRGMLGQVVGQDPAGTLRNPRNYTAGGKSGTANVPVYGTYNDRQIISFVGFAPLDQPKILILVKIDDNADGLTGTVAGGPIFASMADQILAYMGVAPDKGNLKP